MKKRTALAAAALVLGALSVPGSGAVEPGIAALHTANVEHLLTVPLDSDASGGRLVGKDFFVRTGKGITIYDTTVPERPTPKGFVAVPQTPNQEREDIDTNGRILVTGQTYTGVLHVVDVRNRTMPTIVGTSLTGGNHTNTCVLDCTYSYGSEGSIVDLRVPTAPKVVGDWLAKTGVRGSHDLTEVRPGLLVAASNPVTYIDARKPLAPRVIARGVLPDDRYSHGMAWPRKGADRFVLGGSESGYGCTSPEDGTFFVFDTKRKGLGGGWKQTGDFTLQTGLPTTGQSSVNELCGHWFDPHPSFKDGGLVSMAWYGFGVRFLEVTKAGAVKERGWWTPLAGQTSAAYWISKDVVYATDYTARGFDVLKFDATKAPGAPLLDGVASAGERAAATATGAWRPSQDGDLARNRALGRGPEHAGSHHLPDGSLSAIAAAFVCKV